MLRSIHMSGRSLIIVLIAAAFAVLSAGAIAPWSVQPTAALAAPMQMSEIGAHELCPQDAFASAGCQHVNHNAIGAAPSCSSGFCVAFLAADQRQGYFAAAVIARALHANDRQRDGVRIAKIERPPIRTL